MMGAFVLKALGSTNSDSCNILFSLASPSFAAQCVTYLKAITYAILNDVDTKMLLRNHVFARYEPSSKLLLPY